MYLERERESYIVVCYIVIGCRPPRAGARFLASVSLRPERGMT